MFKVVIRCRIEAYSSMTENNFVSKIRQLIIIIKLKAFTITYNL